MDATRKLGIYKWLIRAALLVAVLLPAVWYFVRDDFPPEIRIAAGSPGGLFHRFSQEYAERLQKRLHRPVRLIPTQGAAQNREMLRSGEADLALLQPSFEPMEGLAALAPVYEEAVHVIARKGRGIRALGDLQGKRVAVGAKGSGTLGDAERILAHYRIRLRDKKFAPFAALQTDPGLDAAITTSGFLNPQLAELLGSGAFELLPVGDAEALSVYFPFYAPRNIPHGLYAQRPPVPARATLTVSMKTFLAMRADAYPPLVTEALAVLYESDLRNDIPTLLPFEDAKNWPEPSRHPAVRRYFDPYEGLGTVASFLESVSAIKELLFALGAGLYLLWNARNRLKAREHKAIFQQQKDHLDSLLKETMRIERAQLEVTDAAALQEYMNEVTRIKLRALDELTDEDLRGDQLFSIFLMQCSNLILKLQNKIMLHQADKDGLNYNGDAVQQRLREKV